MDRETLRKLAEATTPGPWFVEDEGDVISVETRVGTLVTEIDVSHDVPYSRETCEADAAFIAAAREAVPALLDENDRLREALRFYAAIRDVNVVSMVLRDKGDIARAALAKDPA